MNESGRPLGGRLPLAGPATLAPAQRELYDQLIGSWVVFTDKLGIRSTTEDGRLIGPFNAARASGRTRIPCGRWRRH